MDVGGEGGVVRQIWVADSLEGEEREREREEIGQGRRGRGGGVGPRGRGVMRTRPMRR